MCTVWWYGLWSFQVEDTPKFIFFNEKKLRKIPNFFLHNHWPSVFRGCRRKNCKQTTGIFLHFAFAVRVWEYFALNFTIFPAGCLRICYSVRPQYWAKKMQFPWKQTVSQILPLYTVYIEGWYKYKCGVHPKYHHSMKAQVQCDQKSSFI